MVSRSFPRQPKSEADQFLDYVAENIGGPGSTVSDPERLKSFVMDTTAEYEAEKEARKSSGVGRSFPRSQFPPPEEDESARLSREVRQLESEMVSPDQVSPDARAAAALRYDPGPSMNPLQMAADYGRALPSAGRVFGEATLTAAYPLSLAGSGAATIGAEKAGLGPGWQTAAGVVGGIAEGPRAVMGARKIAAPLGGIGNPLAGTGRNIAKSTQKLGKAEAQEAATAAKAARGVVNLPRMVPQDAMTGPKQAFHGSGSGFEYEGKAATFFTSDPDVAAQYSTQHGGVATPQVFTRDLSNKRFLDAGTPNGKAVLDTIRASVPIEQINRSAPRVGESTKQLWQRQRDDEWRAIADKLRPMGYDGVRIPVDESPSGTVHDSYLLFEDAGVGNALMPPAPQPRTAGMTVQRQPPIPPAGQQPPKPQNVIGLDTGPVTPSLTKREELMNAVKSTVEKVTIPTTGTRFVRADPVASATLRNRSRVAPAIESQAGRLSALHGNTVAKTFRPDKQGRIQALAGVHPAIPGAPTIQDVAARLPTYEAKLTPAQRDVMTKLRTDVEQYGDLLKQSGVDINSRGDIEPGGFYLPRGRADLEGMDVPLKISSRGSVKRGFERPATFASQAEGIDAGYEYSNFSDTLKSYATSAGKRATDKVTANQLKPFGTPVDPKQGMARTSSMIELPGLEGLEFPDAIANAANKVLISERPLTGKGAVLLNTANAVNNLYRGFRATLDNSGIGIQGLVGLGADQKAYAQALKTNLHAFADEHALGAFIKDFDPRAVKEGRIASDGWAKSGLRIGGPNTEYRLGQGVSHKASSLPLIRHANRAFGYFGDSLRLAWADDLLRDEMRGFGFVRKPRTLQEITASGDLERIAKIANNMTGWTEGKAFGSLGDLLTFAPRFLQARLETVAKAGMGLRPGAKIDQRIARNSMLKMIGWGTLLTVSVNEMLGNETDFRPKIDGEWNPNFMRIRWGGRDWSVFGTWDSLARNIVQTGAGKPQDAGRGLGSGIVANSWDFMSGTDAIGKPVRDTPEQVANRLMENFLPFGAEEQTEAVKKIAQGDVGLGVASGVGSAVGIKSAPLSTQDVREETSQSQGIDYGNMNYVQKVELNQTPEIRKRVVQSALERPDSYSGRKLIAEADYYQREADLLERFFNGTLYPKTSDGKKTTPAQQRARLVDEYYTLQAERRGELGQIKEQFPSDYEADKLGATGPEDTALQAYFDILDKSVNAVGNFDSVKYQTLKAELEKKWTQAQKDYVEKYRRSKEHPPALWQIVNFDNSAGYFGSNAFASAKAIWQKGQANLRQDLLEIAAKSDLPQAVGQ